MDGGTIKPTCRSEQDRHEFPIHACADTATIPSFRSIMRLSGAVFPILTALVWLSAPGVASAQRWGSVEGSITHSESGDPLHGVSIVVTGTNFGTSSDGNGHYSLRLPDGRYGISFSTVGFSPHRDTVAVRFGIVVRLDVALAPSTTELDEVTVEEDRLVPEAGVFEISPRAARDIPAPVRDIARMMKMLPGVATNNELSNQVSVRGGGFNENLFFLNGFEIFLPFRPRQGEQEGLSLLNPDLAERIVFYAGGFPVRYGGKLSSAVEVQYRRPERYDGPPTGTIHASLLEAGLSASGSVDGKRIAWLVGLRTARARQFFATQELKGDYDPVYTDAQASVSWDFSERTRLEAVGIWAKHAFRLSPDARRTFFGTYSQNPEIAPSNLQSLWIQYDAGNEERDGYETGFGGLRLVNRFGGGRRMEHDLSVFSTSETERFELAGTAVLYLVDPSDPDPEPGSGLFPAGSSRQEDAADNRVDVRSVTAQGRYAVPVEGHLLEIGWQGRREHFFDRLDEKSIVSGRSTEGLPVRIVVDSLRDSATLEAWRVALFAQDLIDLLPSRPGTATVTAGLRADWFDFNGQWTISPRLSARYRLNETVQLLGAWGIYYQSPSYRELRGRPKPGETILGALNRDLDSQRSNQVVAGVEVFVPRLRVSLRAEAYAKWLDQVISYDIDNVRVRYSGQNDARGTARGIDLQLHGEFVPGLESWLNYSFLVAREEFLPEFRDAYRTGLNPRPTDQRHTISLLIRDYVPSDPSWQLHLRMLFGSGFPYTPPVPGRELGSGLVVQEPGDRFSARYPRYFRFDMGVTKEMIVFERGSRHPVSLSFTAELLNLFDMTNTVAYSWIPNQSGIWTRVPTRLTPRTFNVGCRVDF